MEEETGILARLLRYGRGVVTPVETPQVKKVGYEDTDKVRRDRMEANIWEQQRKDEEYLKKQYGK